MAKSVQNTSDDVFIGDSDMAKLMRAHDWSTTSLGPPDLWPTGLKVALRLLLTSKFEMWLGWGPEIAFLYNDAYVPTLGEKHPNSLGAPAAKLWAEIWPVVGPKIESVYRSGASTWDQALLLLLNRRGLPEETYHTFSYSPLFGDGGKVEGVFCAVSEETERVISERRLETLGRLATGLAVADTRKGVLQCVETALDANRLDLPFTLTYLFDGDGAAHLASASGGMRAHAAAPARIDPAASNLWRVDEILAGQPNVDIDLTDIGALPSGDWDTAPTNALVVPLSAPGREKPAGVFIAALNPLRLRDETYPDFIKLIAGQIDASLANAEAYEAAQQEALARTSERDRVYRLFEQAPAFIVAMRGPEHVVEFVNDAHRKLFASSDWLGKTMRDAFPSIAGQGFYEKLDQVYQTGEAVEFTAQEVHYRRSADGPIESRLLTFIYAPVIDDKGVVTGIFCEGFDVTEAHTASAALREESRVLTTLNRTGAAIAGQLELQPLVQSVTDAGRELTGAAFGAFFYNVLNDEGESYMLFTLSGADRAAFEHFGMPRATEVFRPTFLGEGVIRSDDIRADPRYGRNAPHKGIPKGHLPVVSYLAVPVASRSGEVIGGLFFGHPEPGKFTERHEEMMLGLAGQASVAIDNARLYAALQRSNETLEQRVIAESAERAKAEEALRQAQKMEAVGQLTGGIAHDFNNLLAGILGSLDMMQRRLGSRPDIDRYIGAARDASNRAAALTQRLLAFSRRQTLDPKPIDVNTLVRGLEELIRRTVGPGVEVEVVAAAGLWVTRADASQLENSLLNLCINARDAMAPGGGRLTIETANKWLDERTARERDLSPGQYVSLSVTDTGVGMAPEIIARAFDPFFTTKPIGQGTGLGLSMIYGFVRQSGGQVRVYSEVGKGTTMCIYLPRHHGDVGENETAKAAERIAPGTGETVLVVDDEPTLRMLIEDVLEDHRYKVLTAPDGPSALKLLQSDIKIDLVITDVGLPGGMNGRQVADAARALRPGLKIIFITGYAENAVIGNGHLEPGMIILTKPFDISALGATVRDVLDKA